MAAGATDRLWEMADVVDMLEAFEEARKRATWLSSMAEDRERRPRDLGKIIADIATGDVDERWPPHGFQRLAFNLLLIVGLVAALTVAIVTWLVYFTPWQP
jgi:hypothetical protein